MDGLPPLIVIERPLAEIQDLCARSPIAYPIKERIGACAALLPSGKRCIVFWPDNYERRGPLWEHEMRHCRGEHHTRWGRWLK